MSPSLGSSQNGQSKSSDDTKKRRKNMKDTSDKGSSSKKKRKSKYNLAEADTQPINFNGLNSSTSGTVEEEVNEEFRSQDSLMEQWLLENPGPEPDPPVVENEIEIIDLDAIINTNNTSTTTTTVNNNNNTGVKSSVITQANKTNIPGPSSTITKPPILIPSVPKALPIKILTPRPLAPPSTSSITTISKTVSNNIVIPTANKRNSNIIQTTNNNNTTTISEIVEVQVLDNPIDPVNLDNFRLTRFSFLGRHKNKNDNAILTGKPKLSDHISIMNALVPEESGMDVDIDIPDVVNGRVPDLKFSPGIDVSISRPLRGQIPVDNIFFVKVTDLFYPVLDDPYNAGKVACLSLLNKLFAVGLVQVDKILMHLTLANDLKPDIRDVVIPKLIAGFQDVALSVGTRVTGGHTILNPWISIGGAATCISTMDELILSQAVVPGDFLVLTKPLGLGVALYVNEILQAKGAKLEELLLNTKLTEEDLLQLFEKAKQLMLESNKFASQLMHKYSAKGAIDLEFGIIPSAQNWARQQRQKSINVPLKLRIANLPCLKHAVEISKSLGLKLEKGLYSEVSGGLLVALKKQDCQHYMKEVNQLQKSKLWKASVVGVVVRNNEPVWTAKLTSNFRILPK